MKITVDDKHESGSEYHYPYILRHNSTLNSPQYYMRINDFEMVYLATGKVYKVALKDDDKYYTIVKRAVVEPTRK
jgi:hypothetical protein